jgi:hypothetical protein
MPAPTEPQVLSGLSTLADPDLRRDVVAGHDQVRVRR